MVHSQKAVEVEQNPCSDRTIVFARKHGVKALPVKDLPQFFKASKACKEKGGETLLEQINIMNTTEILKVQNSCLAGHLLMACVSQLLFFIFL